MKNVIWSVQYEHESSKLNDIISDFYGQQDDIISSSKQKKRWCFCSPDWSHRCCRGAVACSGSHCWSSLRCTPVTQTHTSYCDEGVMKHLQSSQSDVSLWESKCVSQYCSRWKTALNMWFLSVIGVFGERMQKFKKG